MAIAAISTARGKGGIAVIRISGEDTRQIVRRIFTPAGRDAEAVCRTARRAVYGEIHTPDGETLDTGICVFYEGPASFTGEDVAELSCHGGVWVTGAVLRAVLAAGASMAEPGEFTRRAFLNGKLTLTEAEAVGMLIDADTKERACLASGGARGRTSAALRRITERLRHTMTALYAAIDYPDEDVGDEGEREILSTVQSALSDVRSLLASYTVGRAVAQGVPTVLCGRPNAGKSSLFNRLTGGEDAIVTEIAGTTRDVLRQTVSFGGVTLLLSDTAGLRETDDPVEKIGVARARDAMQSAGLVLAVFDPTAGGLGAEEAHMMALYPPVPRIAVLNKADAAAFSPSDEEKIRAAHDACVSISCRTGAGIDALSAAVAHLWGADRLSPDKDPMIWDERQHAALARGESCLAAAEAGLLAGDALDAVCTVCESALTALEETDGRGVTDEIVSAIFSRFCVGK